MLWSFLLPLLKLSPVDGRQDKDIKQQHGKGRPPNKACFSNELVFLPSLEEENTTQGVGGAATGSDSAETAWAISVKVKNSRPRVLKGLLAQVRHLPLLSSISTLG